jgi:hypothetical protein
MKLRNSILFMALAIFTLLQSCEKSEFLDTKPLNAITEDAVFSDPALARASLLTIYGGIPKVFARQGGIPLDMNVRDAAHTFPWGFVNNLRGNNYNAANADYVIQSFWNDNYALIRQTNVFLEGVENSKFTEATKKTFRAEARFLRAVFYFELFRFFRGVPLITQAQALQDAEAFKVKRSTEDETINFIVQELTEVADDLPLQWTGNDWGRAEKGAALGIKARALLYVASLKNDVSLFSQAADAAKTVIDLNRYGLHADYSKMFFDKSSANKEFILFFNKVPSNSASYGSATRGAQDWGDWALANAPLSGGAWGGSMPSQNLVDEFEMTDGKLPEQSPLYNPQDPYNNRDPRFYASIYYQGSTFKGVPLEFFEGGKDYIVNGFTTSGYFVKKAIDENIPDYYAFSLATLSYLDPYLRYADILLMYAEALNEQGKTEEARIYLNQVRARPGVNMPEVSAGLSKEEMRERIRHERHIELVFEESRFHDVRRWGIAQQASEGPVYGAKITKNANGSLNFSKQVLETRTFSPTFILYPIPQDEINKNPNLAPNNPGY